MRIVAILLDAIIIFMAVAILGRILIQFDLRLPVWLDAVFFAIYCAYYTWHGGSTFGKKHSRIKVVSLDGGEVSPSQSVLRSLYMFLPYFLSGFLVEHFTFDFIGDLKDPDENDLKVVLENLDFIMIAGLCSGFISLFPLVDYLWILTNQQRRSLHDVLSGTRCIEIKEESLEAL
jgi:uncharacterized RDD family membrane protein YckC